MRTTIDIADDQYAALKGLAARERTSIRALITEAIVDHLLPRTRNEAPRRFVWPTIGNANGEKPLTPELVAELLMEEPSE